MKKLLETFFPYKLHLTILQLEEYKYPRYLRWVIRNFTKRVFETKKSLVVTPKIKMLSVSSFVLILFIFLTSLIKIGITWSILILLALATQPYLILGLALLLIKPYEIINKKLVIEKIRKKILALKNLKIIAVTGSFGKTSTKEILYQLLKDKYKTLRTPESYNTIFGIAKVIDWELDQSYKFFICEMAAYKRGEIRTLCHMVPPLYGILTGITKQHLERFGSLNNTISAKFELVDAINPHNMVFNLDDSNISQELSKRGFQNPFGYGILSNKAQISATDIKFSPSGSEFTLHIDGKSFPIKTRLFGYSQVKNIIAATAMAIKLGLDTSYLVKRITNLNPFSNRFVLTRDGKTTIVDNTYSSNIEGFKETLNTASAVKGKRVLVTPGVVELGVEEISIHHNLGLATNGVFDKIVLVGENPRTKSFAEAIRDKNLVEFIKDSRNAYFSRINELKGKFDWIFLENDITQNY